MTAKTKDQQTRSRIMAAIRGKDTKPERMLRSLLHARGFRFRLHQNSIPGTPDIMLKKYNAAIFVNGCFWHKHEYCKYSHIPKTRTQFWEKKLARNAARDQKLMYELKLKGVRVAVIWECALKGKETLHTAETLSAWLPSDSEYIEIPSSQAMANG